MLEAVAGNVVLAGGIWRVKGMQNFFKKQIKTFLPQFPTLQKLKVSEKIGKG